MPESERMKRKKSEKRDQILESARKLFFERGFMDTRMEDIAENADLAIGTLYLYFESKNDIQASLCEEGLALMEDLFVSTPLDNVDCWEKLRRTGNIALEFYQQHPDYWQIMTYLFLSAQLEKSFSDLRRRILDGIGYVLKHLQKILREGIEEGEIRECDVEQTALLLWAKILGIIYCDSAGFLADINLSMDQMLMISTEMTTSYLKD